ncbi:RNA polymerase sigma factor [Lignipirellula cremea]|nr:sigma-70 family RNA polymerase sigma factor [Lignipirellula cremea]
MRRLVDQFKGPIFGLCYRMLGQWQDAEDAAQETFVRALKSLANWDASRPFTPWLAAIAANRCRTLLATRKSRPAVTDLVEQIEDNAPDQQAASNLAEEVDLALLGLRDDYRQAFLLFHQQELTYAEIADALGAPLGTVKTWVHRARRGLIERLRERGVVEDSRHELRNL